MLVLARLVLNLNCVIKAQFVFALHSQGDKITCFQEYQCQSYSLRAFL